MILATFHTLDGQKIIITDEDLTEAGRQLLKKKEDFREFHSLNGEKVLIRAKDGEKVLIKSQEPKFKDFYQSARMTSPEKKKITITNEMIRRVIAKIVSEEIDKMRKKLRGGHIL